MRESISQVRSHFGKGCSHAGIVERELRKEKALQKLAESQAEIQRKGESSMEEKPTVTFLIAPKLGVLLSIMNMEDKYNAKAFAESLPANRYRMYMSELVRSGYAVYTGERYEATGLGQRYVTMYQRMRSIQPYAPKE